MYLAMKRINQSQKGTAFSYSGLEDSRLAFPSNSS
jgi:hypothetical protein